MKTTKSTKSSEVVLFPQQPALRLIYDTAPIGLACLSLDCRYLQINQRLTEICGISVEDHLGRSVRECVPALADSVEAIVRSIMETGEPVIGIEVAGQRADQVEGRYWVTYWHPLRTPSGEIVAVNVAAEEITERKRAEGRLRVQHTGRADLGGSGHDRRGHPENTAGYRRLSGMGCGRALARGPGGRGSALCRALA